MSLQDTSQSSCEVAHQSAGAKFAEHQVGVSFTLILLLLSKDFKHTFTLTLFHVCREQGTHTPLDYLQNKGCCVSSGGLKPVYKGCIKLKMDFPWYSAALQSFCNWSFPKRATTLQTWVVFEGCRASSTISWTLCTVQKATVQKASGSRPRSSWTLENYTSHCTCIASTLFAAPRVNFNHLAVNNSAASANMKRKNDQLLRFMFQQNLKSCSI